MRFRLRIKSARHREEAVKLSAVLFNGVVIACFIGASFGPLLNNGLQWGWGSLGLVLAAVLFHALAQTILHLGFADEVQP
ncbi:MAG: hypothetical protein JNJ73_12735 [Hyphomonadaceae bacterium]|nr:hypothetical protein [Hyphomonadaceae bacterium]